MSSLRTLQKPFKATSSIDEVQSFTELYDKYSHQLLRYFVKRTYDIDMSADLVAETYATAIECRNKFRGTSDDEAVAWLFGIARKKLSRALKKGQSERKALRRLKINPPEITDDDRDRIEVLCDLPRLRSKLTYALADLSHEQRHALHLRIVEELSYNEIADKLFISQEAARLRVSRGLRSLKVKYCTTEA